MEDSDGLIAFYEDGYTQPPPRAALYSRWRALGAIGKADHVIELCRRAGLRPATTLDVGCGDGALLCELASRSFGGVLSGIEITEAAVGIASQREQIDAVGRYDGVHVPAGDGSYELGIVSHVLEHVTEPSSLLGEVARACRWVVLEVPLEDNLSARRAGKREHAEEVGHLQRLDRAAIRAVAEAAGLETVEELVDPLPLVAHTFFAAGVGARARAALKWGVRRALHGLSPALAGRLFTLHYAALCRARGG